MRTIVDSQGSIVTTTNRIATIDRIARVIDYVFGVLYTVLLVRLALEFFNARKTSGFYELIQSITDPFYAPFKGIVATHTVDGAPIVWPLLIAVLGYVLLHAAIRGLLRLVARG